MLDSLNLVLCVTTGASICAAVGLALELRNSRKHLGAMHKFAAQQVRDAEFMTNELAALRDREEVRQRQRTEAGRKSAMLRAAQAKARRDEAATKTIEAARSASFRPREEVIAGIRKSN